MRWSDESSDEEDIYGLGEGLGVDDEESEESEDANEVGGVRTRSSRSKPRNPRRRITAEDQNSV